MTKWALAKYRTCSKFGTLHCPPLVSWCPLCLQLSGLWNCKEWDGLEGTFQKLSGPSPHPSQGHHSSIHFFKGPIKLLLTLTGATADPETGTCWLAQTCSNFPWRRCPLTTGQKSFASFKTFARSKRAWRGISPSGSGRCFRTCLTSCWMCTRLGIAIY